MCCVNVSKALSNDFGTCRIDLKQQYHRPLLKHTVLLSGGRIDHGHHDGQAVRALNDAVAMAKACGKAMEMTNRGKQNREMLPGKAFINLPEQTYLG